MNAPLTTSAILDRTTDSPTDTERLARLFDGQHRRLFLLAVRLASDREEARDLVRTLVNLCRDRWRRVAVRVRGRAVLESAGEPAVDPEAAVVARATVHAALAALPPRRRAVIALCELEGQAVRDVARLLGIAEVTVRWHLLAARRELAHVLRGEKP